MYSHKWNSTRRWPSKLTDPTIRHIQGEHMAEKSEAEIDDIASRVIEHLKIGGGGTIGGGTGFACSAVFRCGDYGCVGSHGCPNTFECNIRFSGLAALTEAK